MSRSVSFLIIVCVFNWYKTLGLLTVRTINGTCIRCGVSYQIVVILLQFNINKGYVSVIQTADKSTRRKSVLKMPLKFQHNVLVSVAAPSGGQQRPCPPCQRPGPCSVPSLFIGNVYVHVPECQWLAENTSQYYCQVRMLPATSSLPGPISYIIKFM